MPNTTQNYKLNQWEASDDFLRSDFNEDNAKIEAALTAHDTALAKKAEENSVASRIANLNTAVSTKAELRFGTYTGDGTASRTISLGFTPKWILVFDQRGRGGYQGISYGGLAAPGFPVKNGAGNTLEVVTNGIKVVYSPDEYQNTNENNMVYHYLVCVS